MVAEQHILASLEMAARLRLASLTGDEPPRGLAKLLRAASTKGLIANERLSNRDERALEIARDRHRRTEMRRMNEEGLDNCVVDYTQVRPTEEELQFDWIGRFITALPHLRNMHAHGTDNLRPNVGRSFDIVCELINQLFGQLENQESSVSD